MEAGVCVVTSMSVDCYNCNWPKTTVSVASTT